LVLDVVVVEVEDANQSLEDEDSFGKVKVTLKMKSTLYMKTASKWNQHYFT